MVFMGNMLVATMSIMMMMSRMMMMIMTMMMIMMIMTMIRMIRHTGLFTEGGLGHRRPLSSQYYALVPYILHKHCHIVYSIYCI